MIDSFSGKYRFLSNFYPVEVEFEGLIYPSTEAAFQAAKSLDQITRHSFLNLTPSEAKKKGRHVTLRPDWKEVKDHVMLQVLRSKFTHPVLADKLKETGDQELIEGNNWGDTYWGVCRGRGKNMLGKLLMQVRAEL